MPYLACLQQPAGQLQDFLLRLRGNQAMTYLDRLHSDLTQRSGTPRSWRKSRNHGLHKWLILVAVVLSTLSYPVSAVRGEVAASPGNVSAKVDLV